MNDNTLPLLPLVLADIPATLRSALAVEGVPTCGQTSATIGRFVLFDSRRSVPPQLRDGQQAVDVDGVRDTFEGDPFVELTSRATYRTWWQVGPWQACEETSVVDRRRLRRDVLDKLRTTIEARGGVWMRLAAVPSPYRTAFNFRFDHDEFVASDFTAVMDAVAGRETMTSHFVCASTHQAAGDALRRLDGCDVGSHGFHHHTYRTFAENGLNIARGIETLRRWGFEPSGFAAPHGHYHAELAAAITACGITHSSEFAAVYDDVPQWIDDGGDVLQLPIHPVCLGIVLEAAAREHRHDAELQHRAADDTADYFLATAEAKRRARDLIFLYGHPDRRLGRYPHVLRQLFATVETWPDVWTTSLTEFQRWWRQRAQIRFTVRESAGSYVVDVTDPAEGYTAALEWLRGEAVATLPLDRPTIHLSRDAASFEPIAADDLPRPIRREPIGGWKERLRRSLDWEYATPIDEIDASRLRGRLKRGLRRWKARSR
jgi:hypothetical protein